ncbi:hypothetical protein QYE76_005713 [Lolium multiflorum]|uniref:Rx N-terminal domain-containing protein n=1 Tax=Lolium multiflorum TaxID=4521 RepID=A0AAD8W3E9_LOLMU|nr:hypothetical protein QYE76_005713 [Lolium multiflorum]
MEVSLERILLRAQVIVDEAEGRHITNQGMLRQLGMLRDAMYQGFYVLDTLRYKHFEDDDAGDCKVDSRSWALSNFSSAKRLCLSGSSSSTKDSQDLEVEDVLDRLGRPPACCFSCSAGARPTLVRAASMPPSRRPAPLVRVLDASKPPEVLKSQRLRAGSPAYPGFLTSSHAAGHRV